MRPDLIEAHRELLNWGRWARDQWPAPELDYVPPATSQEYRAPWDPDAASRDTATDLTDPIDELAAAHTEAVVVQIGLDRIDHYRVLVRWYPGLMAGPPIPLDECYKRLARFMHCSFSGARRLREEAVESYWRRRNVREAA